MSFAVAAIVLLVVGAVAASIVSRARGLGVRERTTVERRSGRDRRQRQVPVAVDRRRRARRADDVARAYVERVSA